MEILFENRYNETPEMTEEYIKKILCKKIKNLAIIVMLFSALMLITSLINHRYLLVIIYSILFILSLTVTLFIEKLMRHQFYNNIQNIHGDIRPETILRFSNNINITEGKYSLNIEYSEIKKVQNLKYSYALILGTQQALLIKKDAFSIGDFESFQEFITSKIKYQL